MLGNGHTSDDLPYSDVPVWVSLPAGVTVTEIAGGSNFAAAVTSTGRMLTWGYSLIMGQFVPMDPPISLSNTAPVWARQPAGVRPVAISIGYGFALVAVTITPALGWGANSSGQLGTGNLNPSTTPTPVQVPADLTGVLSSLTLIHTAVGYNHSLGITTSGEVYAWGDNIYGQLGAGQPGGASDVPVQVQLPGNAIAVQVAAGQWHSLALTADGRVFAWGRNNSGQLGQGPSGPTQSATPLQVTGLPATINTISTTNLHNLALAGSDLYGWGDNTWGEIGDGTSNNTRPTPVLVATELGTGGGIFAVAAGGTHSIAANRDCDLYAWGYNYYGQLGTGDSGPGADLATPTQLALPAPYTDARVKTVAAGLTHSLVLTTDGEVLAAGNNSNGQLGTGSTGAIGTPFAPIATNTLPAGTTFGTIAGGHVHSLAATPTGTGYAWGSNAQGQLGTGGPATSNNNTPRAITQSADAPFTILAGGRSHSIAI